MTAPLVSCLCATYGRVSLLREAIGYFLAQDYPAKELIVLNNHPTPIRCDLPGVTVVNMPGHPDLGSCRRTLLKLAQGYIFNTWDDDDRWLPWHLSQGVERLLASGRPGWKPARSWRCDMRSGKPVYDLFNSGCIASALVKAEHVRKVGYVPSSGDDDVRLLASLTSGPDQWAVEEMGWRASYVYTWTGVNNASAILQSHKPLAERDALWKARNADAGDGKPLSAADVRPRYEELLEQCGAGLNQTDADKLRDALRAALRAALQTADRRLRIAKLNGVVQSSIRSPQSSIPQSVIITDTRNRRFLDFIEPGKRYLIQFKHGLGDAIMFWPIFKALQAAKPRSRIDIALWRGQEAVFPEAVADEPEKYDKTFVIRWAMEDCDNLNATDSKAQISCATQIGIKPPAEMHKFPPFRSPLVGVVFTNSRHERHCVPEKVADAIWHEIDAAGFIPLELDTRKFPKPGQRKRPAWANRNLADIAPAANTADNLVGLIQRCHAFVGMDSGQFNIALSVLPLANCMYVKTKFPAAGWRGFPTLDPKNYVPGTVRNWLENCRSLRSPRLCGEEPLK
jgi:hypothetical protein